MKESNAEIRRPQPTAGGAHKRSRKGKPGERQEQRNLKDLGKKERKSLGKKEAQEPRRGKPNRQGFLSVQKDGSARAKNSQI